jgi:hypothetical protein
MVMVTEPRPIELIERMGRLRMRLERVCERGMHHNLADQIDLDGLEAAVEAVEAVLRGDRVSLLTSQKVAAIEAAAVAEAEGRAPVTLVRSQKPPVAKPGRGRGFRASPKVPAEGETEAAGG